MGKHVIRIRIDREQDLYCPYDPEGLTLSNDVLNYLCDRYNEKDPHETPGIVIEATCPIDQVRVNRSMQHTLQRSIENNLRERRFATMRQVRLFLIGLATIAIGIALHNILDAVEAELISVVGSFAIWEAAAIWLEEKPSLRLKRRHIRQIEDTTITIEPPVSKQH